MLNLEEKIQKQIVLAFGEGEDCVLKYKSLFGVRRVDGIQESIPEEAQSSRDSIHPGSTKMYHYLRELYLWDVVKKDIVEFVSNCQQVK